MPFALLHLASTMRDQLCDSAPFDAPAVQSYLAGIRAVAAVACDDAHMMLAGRWAWDIQCPFSPFELRRAQRSAAELIAHFDTMDAPGEPVVLDRHDTAAVLRARMMGRNTRALLRAAMADVTASPPGALVMDLRGNAGDAFAVVDRIEPLIDFTAGGLRIEGQGVDPDVAVAATAAQEAALRLLQSGEARSMRAARCSADASRWSLPAPGSADACSAT